jgi:hypothetical protein
MRAFAVLAVVLALAGCEERAPAPPSRPSEPERPPARDLDAALAAAPDASGFDASAAAKRVVADMRSERLDVAPRRVPAQRVAFGKERLAQLTDSELVIRGTKDMKEITRLPITQPRRVVTLVDGSVLAAGSSDVWYVPRDPKKAERYSRLPLFPDSLVLGDRRDKKKIWVHHGIDPSLYPYELGELGRLDTLDLIPLADADQKGFALLKDGSYVYTAGSVLKRFFPGGKHWSMTLPEGGEVWRVLTTRRLDEIWLARSDGRLQLVQLAAASLAVKKTLELPGTFDLATNDSEVALLRLETGPSDAGSRSWKLVVLDADGKERMATELPLAGATATEDWVREITKNRSVVLSPSQPLVAVGGPTWLAVWRTRTGEQVLAP